MFSLLFQLAAGATEVAVFGSASETFSRKNINCSIDESMLRFEEVINAAKDRQIPVRGFVLEMVYNVPLYKEQNRISDLIPTLGSNGNEKKHKMLYLSPNEEKYNPLCKGVLTRFSSNRSVPLCSRCAPSYYMPW